jgi:hypothetical protein
MVEQNKPIRNANSGGQPLQYNGTATITPATINFSFNNESVRSTQILVKNAGASGLLLGLDGTANTYSVAAGEEFYLPVELDAVDVSTASGTADYEMVITF